LSGSAGFKLRVSVPAAAVETVEAALQALGGAVARDAAEGQADVALEVYFAERPMRTAVAAALSAAGFVSPRFSIEALPALDWVAESQKGLPPLSAGRFFVFASHAAEERPPSAIAIRIEAGQAFGTGHHESTRGCLLALEALARRGRPRKCPRTCLDLGCGSGILAIAMAKLWHAPVVACDIDPLAVAITQENARLNGVGPAVRAVLSDGASRRSLRRRGPYEVIAANILAAPLGAMAGDLRRVLAPGGSLILSGLLRSQEQAVLARYRARHLRLKRRLLLGDWSTLVLK
jgi:ribosomal protein L11 methyltransferase